MSDVNDNHMYANDARFSSQILTPSLPGSGKQEVSYAQNVNDSYIWIFTTGNALQDVKSYAALRSETLLHHFFKKPVLYVTRDWISNRAWVTKSHNV